MGTWHSAPSTRTIAAADGVFPGSPIQATARPSPFPRAPPASATAAPLPRRRAAPRVQCGRGRRAPRARAKTKKKRDHARPKSGSVVVSVPRQFSQASPRGAARGSHGGGKRVLHSRRTCSRWLTDEGCPRSTAAEHCYYRSATLAALRGGRRSNHPRQSMLAHSQAQCWHWRCAH